jgi:hypothetical protein
MTIKITSGEDEKRNHIKIRNIGKENRKSNDDKITNREDEM